MGGANNAEFGGKRKFGNLAVDKKKGEEAEGEGGEGGGGDAPGKGGGGGDGRARDVDSYQRDV